MVLAPARLVTIADLQPMLVGPSSLDRRRVATKWVAQQPQPLVALGLHAQVERGPARVAGIEQRAARAGDRLNEELAQVGSAADAVDSGVCTPRDRSRLWHDTE